MSAPNSSGPDVHRVAKGNNWDTRVYTKNTYIYQMSYWQYPITWSSHCIVGHQISKWFIKSTKLHAKNRRTITWAFCFALIIIIIQLIQYRYAYTSWLGILRSLLSLFVRRVIINPIPLKQDDYYDKLD